MDQTRMAASTHEVRGNAREPGGALRRTLKSAAYGSLTSTMPILSGRENLFVTILWELVTERSVRGDEASEGQHGASQSVDGCDNRFALFKQTPPVVQFN